LLNILREVTGNVSAVRDFAAVRTERGRPLPVNLSVWSIFHTKSYNVCLYYCLAGNSRITRSTFQSFSTRKTLLILYLQKLALACLRRWRQLWRSYDVVHFPLLCKEYLTLV